MGKKPAAPPAHPKSSEATTPPRLSETSLGCLLKVGLGRKVKQETTAEEDRDQLVSMEDGSEVQLGVMDDASPPSRPVAKGSAAKAPASAAKAPAKAQAKAQAKEKAPRGADISQRQIRKLE